jgi:hypothetical protein
MQKKKLAGRLKTAFIVTVIFPALVIGAEAASIAGLAPYERPAGAPVIKNVTRTPEWRAKVTQGVAQPLPSGLGFLNDQGAWYSPFAQPGMPGYYDIRGWHKKTPAKP